MNSKLNHMMPAMTNTRMSGMESPQGLMSDAASSGGPDDAVGPFGPSPGPVLSVWAKARWQHPCHYGARHGIGAPGAVRWGRGRAAVASSLFHTRGPHDRTATGRRRLADGPRWPAALAG